MDEPEAQIPYLFAEFQLDPLRRVLLKEGRPVALNPKAVEVLLALVEKRADVLSKDELLKTVWPGQIVEENNLTVHISALRKALGEKRDNLRFIVTIPGRGYRFIGDVSRVDLSTDLIIEHHSTTHVRVEQEEVEPEAVQTRIVSEKRWVSPASAPAVRTRLLAKKVGVAVVIVVLLFTGALVAYRSFSSRKGAAQFERYDVKRLTSTGKVLSAVVSPSSQYVAFAQTEGDGQSLWVRHVQTGGGKRILEPRPVEYWGLAFTPDNNYIYATTFEKGQSDPVLSKVPVLGGAIERLPVVTNAGVSFSPDGLRMAYVVSSSSSGGSLLWTANVDGSEKKLVALRKDPNFFAMAGDTVAWSPDGGTIACLVLDNTNDGISMSIVGYSPLDGKERQLTTRHWNIITGVAWIPHGEGLVLSGNVKQGLPPQVWFVSAEGKDTHLLTNDLNSYGGVSLTSDGNSLVTVQIDTNTSIWIGQTDGDFRATNLHEDFSEVGEIPAVGLATEGRIAYLSVASGAPELWLLETANGRTRQVTVNGQVSEFTLSPDGRYVILVSNRAGKPNLWRIDSDGSNFKQLTFGDGEVHPRCASDCQQVFFQEGFGEVLSSVWKISIDGGELHQVTHPHQNFPDISPDGEQIAYSYMDTSATDAGQWRLGIAGVADGKQFASFAVPASVTNRFLRWAPDGQGLVFINTVGGVSNLWLQPILGRRARQLTDLTSQTIDAFDLARDGRKLALVRSIKTSDVVLINNRR
jgi:DNA-binding winged helix-turn-helix (wHTH) protein/Tol biopolymer transport system component